MPPVQNLPVEIISQIFSYLPLSSLPACALTSRLYDHVIKGSVTIQYALAKEKAGVEDSPLIGGIEKFSVSEKLSLLAAREDAWKQFNYKFVKKITVDLPRSKLYNIIADTLIVGCDDPQNTTGITIALKYLRLPRNSEGEVVWRTLDVNRPIISFGAALEEHDLIALACCTDSSLDGLEIVLRQFSTQSKHPHAEKSTIHVLDGPWPSGLPKVGIDICGENLVLFIQDELKGYYSLHIFDWKIGVQKFEISECKDSYLGSAFLRSDIFIKPYICEKDEERDYHLEIGIYHLPKARYIGPNAELFPFLVLLLPELDNDDVYVTELFCHGGSSLQDPLSLLLLDHMLATPRKDRFAAILATR
ncbi:hypothetical protein BDQ17DRAFT_1434265 [Cyathus striatus]|nr:hypothetical protein BDQ17DRAFT_1434265 [Cyathus striatus]